MTPIQAPRTLRQRSSIRRYIPATILAPLVGASLGVDGGPIFQILAVENLGLSAAAIGIAFGFGVVSVPIQLYASRLPIERARRNVQIFLAIAALQAWVLALLVGLGATGGFATVALGVTITAEISVSVLYATAWQPLLASGVGARGRQQLNSTWPAIARGVLAGALVLFRGPRQRWPQSLPRRCRHARDRNGDRVERHRPATASTVQCSRADQTEPLGQAGNSARTRDPNRARRVRRHQHRRHPTLARLPRQGALARCEPRHDSGSPNRCLDGGASRMETHRR